MGLFGGGNAISWTNRAKCPPIDDCPVKNTVKKGGRGKPTRKQAQTAKQLAAAQRAARGKRGKAAAPEPEPRRGWPFAGSYNPKQDRQRGR